MAARLTALLGFCLLTGACASGPAQQAPNSKPGPKLVIHVVARGAEPVRPLDHVEVSCLSDTRIARCGKASGGVIRLSKEPLVREKVTTLLFCRKGYLCKTLGVEEERILEHDELWDELAPFLLR